MAAALAVELDGKITYELRRSIAIAITSNWKEKWFSNAMPLYLLTSYTFLDFENCEEHTMPYYPMMDWYPFMGFWMNFVWLIIIAVIAYFIYKQFKGGTVLAPSKNAEDLLAERYAKGELTREQFMEMKEDIKKST
ncbi:MAG: SHOCT domain-containing protein [Methanothrix sp.]